MNCVDVVGFGVLKYLIFFGGGCDLCVLFIGVVFVVF